LDAGGGVFQMRRKTIVLLILSLFIFSCVYYNTFYHAEQSYKKAEKSQRQAKREVAAGQEVKDYDEAIKKASKVLTFHSRSKWVDDALFLIGRSYYNMGDYVKAERKFKELVSNFPKSNLAEESYYYLGMSQYKSGSKLEATKALISLLDNPKMKKRKSEVCFELGEIKSEEEEYAEAIKFYKRMLSQYPKDELDPLAQFRIGEAYFKLKDFHQAKENFTKVEKYEKQGELAYKSIFWTGETAYQLKNYKEGLNIFYELSREKRYVKYLPQIELKIAEGYRLQDSLDLALKKYEDITLTYPKTEESAEAYYHAGRIYLEKKRDLEKAQEFFEKAKAEKFNSPFAKLALEKSADISKLSTYREQISREGEEKAVKSLFLLAEFYLTQMNMPESALAEYQVIVKEYPQSEYSPKSLYAIAWIYENAYQDSLRAQEFYQRLIKEYPNCDYTKEALLALGLPGDSLEVNLAEKEYLLAESLLFKEEKIELAKEIFQKILENYPQSKYACKSEYALAWILEQYANPGDSSVILAYQELIDKYPGTEYADFAKNRLGIKVKKAPPPPQETQPAAADTSDTTQTQTPTPYANIPRPPEPLQKGVFVYPQSQIYSGIKGKVILKIKIDFVGKVTDVVVLESLNNLEIDEAAKEAARNTAFDPQEINPLELGGWFLYEIDASPPVMQEQQF
jgi:TonB family protein